MRCSLPNILPGFNTTTYREGRVPASCAVKRTETGCDCLQRISNVRNGMDHNSSSSIAPVPPAYAPSRNLNELFPQRPLLRNLFQYRAPPHRQVPAPYPTRRILPCKPQQLSLKQVLPSPDVIQLVQRFLARLAVRLRHVLRHHRVIERLYKPDDGALVRAV